MGHGIVVVVRAASREKLRGVLGGFRNCIAVLDTHPESGAAVSIDIQMHLDGWKSHRENEKILGNALAHIAPQLADVVDDPRGVFAFSDYDTNTHAFARYVDVVRMYNGNWYKPLRSDLALAEHARKKDADRAHWDEWATLSQEQREQRYVKMQAEAQRNMWLNASKGVASMLADLGKGAAGSLLKSLTAHVEGTEPRVVLIVEGANPAARKDANLDVIPLGDEACALVTDRPWMTAPSLQLSMADDDPHWIRLHRDPRGIALIPSTHVERLRNVRSYDAAIAEVESELVWLRRPIKESQWAADYEERKREAEAFWED